MPRVNFTKYVGHASIFSWMLAYYCMLFRSRNRFSVWLAHIFFVLLFVVTEQYPTLSNCIETTPQWRRMTVSQRINELIWLGATLRHRCGNAWPEQHQELQLAGTSVAHKKTSHLLYNWRTTRKTELVITTADQDYVQLYGCRTKESERGLELRPMWRTALLRRHMQLVASASVAA